MGVARGADLQYGGRTLEAAAAFWTSCSPHRGALGHGRPDLRGALAFARLVARLPRFEVRLSETGAGRRIGAHLAARTVGGLPKHRLAQAVLVVPPSMESYLSGRSRRATRTNLARAVRAGFAVKELVSLEERLDALRRNAGDAPTRADREWLDLWSQRTGEEGRVWLAAFDQEGSLKALAVATVDMEWAMLEVGIAREHCARWLVETAMLERLVQSRALYLLPATGNALSGGPSVRHFQRLMGYTVANLRVARS